MCVQPIESVCSTSMPASRSHDFPVESPPLGQLKSIKRQKQHISLQPLQYAEQLKKRTSMKRLNVHLYNSFAANFYTPSRGTAATHQGNSVSPVSWDRLVGLVVKAASSRAEDPGFASRLRRDFSGTSHASDYKIGTPVATMPGAWRYRVSAGTGWPGVSIL